MDEEALGLLCEGWWVWPGPLGCSIGFKNDNTGELTCGIELNTFIAAEFDWKPLEITPLASEQTAGSNSDFRAKLTIELTLTKRRIPKFGDTSTEGWVLHDTNLTEEAFRPKTYSVHLGRGRFAVNGPYSGRTPVWYGRQLVFDKSPYPPLEEWAKSCQKPVASLRFYERTDFYGDMDEDQFKLKAVDKEEVKQRRLQLGIGRDKD